MTRPSPKPRRILNAPEILLRFRECELFGDALLGYRYLQIIGLRAVARSAGTPRRERGREGGLWRGFGGKPSVLDYAARLT